MAENTFWSTVTRFENGDPLDQETLNVPIDELSARDEWLRNQLKALGSPNGAITVTGLEPKEGTYAAPSVGDIVFISTDGKTIEKAIATKDTPNNLLGLYTSQESGAVVFFGHVMIGGTSETRVNGIYTGAGIYYLSTTTPGAITKDPGNGPRVLVGTILDNESYIVLGIRDLATAHVHRSEELVRTTWSEVEGEAGWEQIQQGDDAGKYKYHMKKGSMLSDFYPPVPKYAATLVINGLEKTQGTDFEIRLDGIYLSSTIDPTSTDSIV